MSNVPDTLYRFCRFIGEEKGYIEQLLLNNEIYFQSPVNQLDPFDSVFRPEYDPTDDGVRLIARDTIDREQPGLEPAKRAMEVSKLVKLGYRDNPSMVKEIEARFKQEVRATTGVLNLTSRCDDVRMWTQYAHGHSGLCLVFKRAGLFAEAEPINYSDERPVIPCDGPFTGREILESLKTKPVVWQYEDEWRIIHTAGQGGPGVRTFEPEHLVAIIVGWRMPASAVRELQGILYRRHGNLDLYKAEPIRGSYLLEIKPTV